MRGLSETKERILWRREMIKELKAKGLSDKLIAERLEVARSTIISDVKVLMRQAETDDKHYGKKLSYEYNIAVTAVRLLLKWAWETLQSDKSSEKERINASHIILKCCERIESQVHDKFNIMEGKAEEEEMLKPSLEDTALREAYEQQRLQKGRVF